MLITDGWWAEVTSKELRLADLLAALSVPTDLGIGQQPEKAIRSGQN